MAKGIFRGPPLTHEQAGTTPAKPKERISGRYLFCTKCHKPGGTLIAKDDNVRVHEGCQ